MLQPNSGAGRQINESGFSEQRGGQAISKHQTFDYGYQ